MLGLIKRIYTFLDKESVLCPYTAMVSPILEYGVTVWSPYRKGDIDAVESVQRRATRILPELRGLDYEARLRSLKLPTLTYRRLRGDVINVYKYIHGSRRSRIFLRGRPFRMKCQVVDAIQWGGGGSSRI